MDENDRNAHPLDPEHPGLGERGLRHCANCGLDQIPDEAMLCPRCGQSTNDPDAERKAAGCAITILGCAGLVIALAGGFLTCLDSIGAGLRPGEYSKFLWIVAAGVAIIMWALVLAVRNYWRQ